MGLMLGLVLRGLVWAAIPIELPASEEASAWSSALLLGGLESGPAAGDVWIRVIDQGHQWTLEIRDRAGRMHTVVRDEPRTAVEREALILLAASLLEPSQNRSLPQLRSSNRTASIRRSLT